MEKLLAGKRALITGGSAGIGKAIATLFLEQGAHVAIFGTNRERAEEAVAELSKQKIFPEQEIQFFLVDVSQTKEVEEAILSLLEKWGAIDLLINNAGITRDNLLMRMSEEDWDRVIDVNLKSVYNTCRIVCRPMMKRRSGVIVNVASVVGLVGNIGQANYTAAKSGMIGLTKTLAKEFARRGIRVNGVAPGFVETQMTDQLPESVKKEFLTGIPLGRFGNPREVAYAVLYLSSDLSNYVTGEIVRVDGGMAIGGF